MEDQIIQIDSREWRLVAPQEAWIRALEAGKGLYFPQLAFVLHESEKCFLTPAFRNSKIHNISFNADGETV